MPMRSALNTWVPTFPNARFVFSQREYAATRARHAAEGHLVFVESVLRVVEAGRADLVGDDHELGDHVGLLPTRGHTERHVAICFAKGNDAVMTGDLIHVRCTCGIGISRLRATHDPLQSAATRRSLLERYCDTQTLGWTAHFPSPSVGRLKQWGDGYRLGQNLKS